MPSYLAAALRKRSNSGPSTQEQLDLARKNGNRNYAAYLEEIRLGELAAEAQTAARVKELEGVLRADAIEAERLRVQGILSLPETDEKAIRLNSYCEKLADKPAMHSASEEDWRALAIATIPAAQTFLQGQGHAQMDGKEIELCVKYAIANGLYLGDQESYVSAFFNLKNHGVIRVPAPVAAPVEKPAPGRFDNVQTEIERLQSEASKLPFDSRERNAIERRILALQVKVETLGDDSYTAVIDEIVNATGLTLSGENSFKFRAWLDLPQQRRRFHHTRIDLRLAFAEFFAYDSFLTEDERNEIQYRKSISAMDSQSIKAAVGSFNYGAAPMPHAGIRQEATNGNRNHGSN